jgi:mono/diheme cytochrome c family protein
MNNYASAMLIAGLVLIGVAPSTGTDPVVAYAPHVPAAAVPEGPLDETLNEVVQQYCVRCHSDRRMTGNMSLEGFDIGNPMTEAELAEKVVHKLRAGMMPPATSRRPPEDTLALLAETLENALDKAARDNPNPGYRTFQRLNRAEYQGAARELFGFEIDASAFLPNETMSENFDNIADMQMLSATLMEGYMRAAGFLSRAAVGDPDASPSSAVFKVAKTMSQMVHIEGTPLGTRGGTSVVHNFLADGEYIFELELHPEPTGNLYGLTSPNEQLEVSINGSRVALLYIDRWMSESDPTGLRLETPSIHVPAGPHRVSAAFIQKFEGPVVDLITPVDYTLADSQIGTAYGVTTGPHLRDMTISGPFSVSGVSETPARNVIFTCRPTSMDEERPCAEEIVEQLASKAYRRPLKGDDLSDLMVFFDQGNDGGGFEDGIRTALQAILASPHFVFRLEEIPSGVTPGDVYDISANDLATRLSFFLWATPPDAELIAVAESGDLTDSDVLEEQTRRMLADPRAESLATRFASQWLRLQDLEKIHPDAQLYPYYDNTLTEAMDRETELLFHNIVQEDENIFDLLTADYTFVNERLARHYGLPDVTGPHFRKVPIADANRRGLLGHASILMMTSHANRTSPVLRGKWVMEVLLGSPPPPPPPNIPAFEETDAATDGRELTTRERMEQHRANPSCSSCHNVIDPIGLALDNFDVTGAWRIKENGMEIDASGQLYDGSPINGPADLRNAILSRPSVFVRTFARNMMAYALGRRVEYFDMPTIREIEADASENGYKMSSFIIGVVQSPAFRMSKLEAVADEMGH